MTQPSPQDDLPPGPYRIDGHTVLTEDGTVFAWAHGKTPEQGYAIARAIAAIPEMRAELDRLFADLTQMTAMQDATHKFRVAAEQENDRLRAEKVELIDMLSTRTTHPEYVELLRRYKPKNQDRC